MRPFNAMSGELGFDCSDDIVDNCTIYLRLQTNKLECYQLNYSTQDGIQLTTILLDILRARRCEGRRRRVARRRDGGRVQVGGFYTSWLQWENNDFKLRLVTQTHSHARVHPKKILVHFCTIFHSDGSQMDWLANVIWSKAPSRSSFRNFFYGIVLGFSLTYTASSLVQTYRKQKKQDRISLFSPRPIELRTDDVVSGVIGLIGIVLSDTLYCALIVGFTQEIRR